MSIGIGAYANLITVDEHDAIYEYGSYNLNDPRYRNENCICDGMIVIIENDGLFYMIHGDITYVDAALYENKLSMVFDDLPAARETLDRVREFVKNHPTVYCGTHTPQGYENLEAKKIMDLDNPVPTVLAEVDFSRSEGTGKYVCSICGYVYDPAEHDGIAFKDLPDDWKCPRCKQPKEKFNKAWVMGALLRKEVSSLWRTIIPNPLRRFAVLKYRSVSIRSVLSRLVTFRSVLISS